MQLETSSLQSKPLREMAGGVRFGRQRYHPAEGWDQSTIRDRQEYNSKWLSGPSPGTWGKSGPMVWPVLGKKGCR